MLVRLIWVSGALALGLLVSGNAPAQDSAPGNSTPVRANDLDIQQKVAAAKAAENAGDFHKGIGLWLPLALQGVAVAETRLGMMYFGSDTGGVCEDDAKAAEWVQMAADQGFVEAYRDLGEIYSADRSTVHDPVKAFTWYQKAADLGDAVSQDGLGGLLWQGKGASKDHVKATYWFEKAASQGDDKNPNSFADAHMLGGIYSRGDGIPPNYKKAIYWYLKAANKGFPNAQIDLAALYERQDNYVEAYKWYALVVANDDKLASARAKGGFGPHASAQEYAQDTGSRDRVAAKLTPAQRAKAENWLAEANIPLFDLSPRPVSLPPRPRCP